VLTRALALARARDDEALAGRIGRRLETLP